MSSGEMPLAPSLLPPLPYGEPPLASDAAAAAAAPPAPPSEPARAA